MSRVFECSNVSNSILLQVPCSTTPTTPTSTPVHVGISVKPIYNHNSSPHLQSDTNIFRTGKFIIMLHTTSKCVALACTCKLCRILVFRAALLHINFVAYDLKYCRVGSVAMNCVAYWYSVSHCFTLILSHMN